jgi:hypothetical protein
LTLQGGDRFKVVIRGDFGDVTASVTDQNDGTYLATYTVAQIGNYELAVLLRGVRSDVHILSSPFPLSVVQGMPEIAWSLSSQHSLLFLSPFNVTACGYSPVFVPANCHCPTQHDLYAGTAVASQSSVVGRGLSNAAAWEDVVLAIHTRDEGGNSVDAENALRVVAESADSAERIHGIIKRSEIGTYEGRFLPRAIGEYLVRVYLKDKEVQGSPLGLHVYAGPCSLFAAGFLSPGLTA